MSIKNINEIQSSNYIKHSEQFYQESLSALSNSGQRFGTPGSGYDEISLSLKDIFTNITWTTKSNDKSYVLASVCCSPSDLERYNVIISDISEDETRKFTYVSFKQVQYSSDEDSWYSSELENTFLFKKNLISDLKIEEKTIETSGDYTLTSDDFAVLTADSIETAYKNNHHRFLLGGSVVEEDSSDSSKKYTHQFIFDLRQISVLEKELLTQKSEINTIWSNYVINNIYDCVYEGSDDEIAEKMSSFNFLKNFGLNDDETEIKYILYKVNSTVLDLDEYFQKDFEKIRQKILNADVSQVISEEAIESFLTDHSSTIYSKGNIVCDASCKWDSQLQRFNYSPDDESEFENHLLKDIKFVVKNLVENYLKTGSKEISKRFISKFVFDNFYDFYQKLSDTQIQELEDEDYLKFDTIFNINTNFNILVKTGEDGSEIDDTRYFGLSNPISVNQCVTDNFDGCISKFILTDENTVGINVISNAGALYNENVKDKYLNVLFNYKFNYLDNDSNTQLLSSQFASLSKYVMPYLNDNGYWIINNQETGVLGTCKHTDQPNVVFVHIFTKSIKNEYGDNVQVITSEILSSYRKEDFEQVGTVQYEAKVHGLINNNVSEVVPVLLPDFEEAVREPSKNYLTEYLRSSLFICITDIDCIQTSTPLTNCFFTTFWVYDEEKRDSKYFKCISNSDNYAFDFNTLTNFNQIINAKIDAVSFEPDKYEHTQLVFDKITSEGLKRYPVIKNISSTDYQIGKSEDDAYMHVIPVEGNFHNEANLIVGFASDVLDDTKQAGALSGKIENITRTGYAMTMDMVKGQNSYTSTVAKLSNANDYIFDHDFTDTMDLSGVLINHANVFNRVNVITPDQNGFSYASYFGTSSDVTDKSYFYIGTTEKRVNINGGLLNEEIENPFETHKGIKIEFPNIINNATNVVLNASESVLINSPHTEILGIDFDSHRAPAWIWSGHEKSYTSIIYPVVQTNQKTTYTSEELVKVSTSFLDDNITNTYLNVSKYIEQFYTLSPENKTELKTQVEVIDSTPETIALSPIAVQANYDKDTCQVTLKNSHPLQIKQF
jgi:hypothetical protein